MYRGLLAFWIGGASASLGAPPPAPTVTPVLSRGGRGGGGGFDFDRYKKKKKLDDQILETLKKSYRALTKPDAPEELKEAANEAVEPIKVVRKSREVVDWSRMTLEIQVALETLQERLSDLDDDEDFLLIH